MPDPANTPAPLSLADAVHPEGAPGSCWGWASADRNYSRLNFLLWQALARVRGAFWLSVRGLLTDQESNCPRWAAVFASGRPGGPPGATFWLSNSVTERCSAEPFTACRVHSGGTLGAGGPPAPRGPLDGHPGQPAGWAALEGGLSPSASSSTAARPAGGRGLVGLEQQGPPLSRGRPL